MTIMSGFTHYIKIVIFHSYVSSPEGTSRTERFMMVMFMLDTL